MTAPQITKVLNPPLISDSVEDFNVKAFQTVSDLNPMMSEANAVATYINTKAGEVADNVATAAGAAAAANTATTKAAEAAASATAADASKTAAAASATSAAGSASTATTQATAAGNSATAAASSATAANTAKTAAETAATNAGNSASAAATSATTAGTAATNASNSASTASTKASEATAAATAAAGSASAASTSASNAATSEANAATSESNAADSAAAAAQSAQDAADIAVGDVMSNVTPQALGAADAGTGVKASREDHAHPMPTAAQVGAAPAAHAAATNNPHGVTAAQVGAEPAISAGTNAQYLRGDKTWQTLNKAAVGLGSVDNTSDAAKPISAAAQTALDAKADLVGGKVPEAQLPAIAIADVFSVASQAAMLALTAERGDIAVRTDINKSFALSAEPASTLANWIELRTPTDAVLSVNSKTGSVTLNAADVGLSNVDNTADANKPVATTSVNGLMSAADKTKLNGVASGATANATDAQLRDRSTHTGSQAISTVTGLQTALDSIPANSKASAYTLVLADAGTSIDTTSNVTIPANSAVAFPVGTTIMITNTSASNSTISINTDTLRQAGTTNTGSRTLAGYGIATLRKVNSTTWYISGAGLS